MKKLTVILLSFCCFALVAEDQDDKSKYAEILAYVKNNDAFSLVGASDTTRENATELATWSFEELAEHANKYLTESANKGYFITRDNLFRFDREELHRPEDFWTGINISTNKLSLKHIGMGARLKLEQEEDEEVNHLNDVD